MPTYTMALKTVHEFEGGNVGLNDYPIFDEKYRDTLNQKILDHYWNQEIGQESISMWRFAMARKMNEIMPLYNQHYELSLLKIDPLSTVNIKSLVAAVTSEQGTTEGTTKGIGSNTSTESVAGHSENSSTSGAQSRAVASDTPQTALQVDADYATSMQDTNSGSTASGQADDTRNTTADTQSVSDATSAETMASQGTADTNQETTGYNGHAPQLILQARQALVNIDMMIINELQDLFMLVWSNNDSYTERRYPYYGFFR